MAEWVGLAAEWLRPIYRHIRQEVLSRGYVQIDETPIRYFAPGNGTTRLGYLWTCGVPHGDVIFHSETSRTATCLDNIIPADFPGTLQCDGDEAYDCFARRRGDAIVLAGCLAYVRRNFYKAPRHRATAPLRTRSPAAPRPGPAQTSAQPREQARANPCSHGCTAPSCG